MNRVLLVDDNPADRRLFQMAVDASGTAWEVVTAGDGDGAFAYLAAGGQIDLLVLDWRLVRSDGDEVLKHLKGSPCLSSLPVIVFSSSQSPAELDRANRLGVPWVQKPLNAIEYFRTVAEILSRGRPAVSSAPHPGREV
jgi:CheY-like chemotaxis protein